MKIITSLLILMLVLWQLNGFLDKVSSLIVFDIDLARVQFIDESRSMFMQGCLQGHKHYPIIPRAVVGFDADSPSFYCSDWADKNLDYLQEQAGKLGRKTN